MARETGIELWQDRRIIVKVSAAVALTLEVCHRFPEYALGQVNLALILLEKGEQVEARRLLNPLPACKRLHLAEFSAIST